MNSDIKNILLMPFNLLYKINPVLCTKIMFYLKLGEKLDLDHPITFNQKLQWIKLYVRDPLIEKCVDKYTVREYVKQAGCTEILNELYWQGYDPSEIPFDSLPAQFVIKATHGSGMNIICKDKNTLDSEKTIKQLKKWLKYKYLPCYGEWFYGQVKPRIIVEKFLGNEKEEEPSDYKVYCFNGEPKLVSVHTGRFTNHKQHNYDLDWNVIKGVNLGGTSVDENEIIPRPALLDSMLDYARRLSKSFVHVRVDFYLVNNKVYFGELTFTDGAGFDLVTPRDFNLLLGSYITLPTDRKAESLF